MREVELSNKKILSVSTGSFIDASLLKAAVIKEITSQGFSIPELDAKDVMKTKMDTGMLMGIVTKALLIESNEDITNKVLDCAKKCLYNKEKVTPDIFEDPELWPVLLEIKIEIIKENVLPFFLNLPSIVKKLIKNFDLGTILK